MFSRKESYKRQVAERKKAASKSGLSTSLLDEDFGDSHGSSLKNKAGGKKKTTFKREVELQSSTENPGHRVSGSGNPLLPSRDVVLSASDDNIQPETLAEGQDREDYTWDFCLVLPNPEDEEFKTQTSHENFVPAVEIIERLQLAGLQTYQFYSGDGDEIIVKIRAPLKVLRHHAEFLGIKMLLSQDYLENVLENQNAKIGEAPEVTTLSPYEFIYAPYNDLRREMFEIPPGMHHPFTPLLRIKIIYQIIVGDGEDCCSLNMRRMAKDGSSSVISYYPLHNLEQRAELERAWFNWRVHPWEQPIDDVKEYLGEKVALYFEFTGHYTTWLAPLAVSGIVVAIYLLINTALTNDFDESLSKGYIIPFYCIFVSFWAQLMLEFWKRKEARKSMEWGTSGFEEEENDRPEFYGMHNKEIHSIVNGRLEKYYPSAERAKKVRYSNFIVAMMILLVVICVSGIFGLQVGLLISPLTPIPPISPSPHTHAYIRKHTQRV